MPSYRLDFPFKDKKEQKMTYKTHDPTVLIGQLHFLAILHIGNDRLGMLDVQAEHVHRANFDARATADAFREVLTNN